MADFWIAPWGAWNTTTPTDNLPESLHHVSLTALQSLYQLTDSVCRLLIRRLSEFAVSRILGFSGNPTVIFATSSTLKSSEPATSLLTNTNTSRCSFELHAQPAIHQLYH